MNEREKLIIDQLTDRLNGGLSLIEILKRDLDPERLKLRQKMAKKDRVMALTANPKGELSGEQLRYKDLWNKLCHLEDAKDAIESLLKALS